MQRWTCSAAPIHDPDTGAVIGVIDLTGDLSTVHPHSLAVATATARAVEASLQLALQERDARLHAALRQPRLAATAPRSITPSGRAIGAIPPGWGVAGRLAIPPGGGELVLPVRGRGRRRAGLPHARGLRRARRRATPRDVASTGRWSSSASSAATARRWRSTARTTELRPRLAEILALLCAHPNGMSADALCADLHGDGGSVCSVRVEVSRLRKLLGPWIDTDRYRLTCDVETDVRRDRGPARRGAVREAAEAYAGPLLPASEAPGWSVSASAWTTGSARP